ncbi:MAG: rubredoxin-like domain-containing protein [Halobacteriaceae archaeon]
MTDAEAEVLVGQTVYDGDGNALGTVRGLVEDGFTVATVDGIEALSVEHSRAGHKHAEGELTWQCGNCGTIDDIEDIPDTCPDCGAPPEELYYRLED